MAFTPWKMFHKDQYHRGRGDRDDVIYVGSSLFENNLNSVNPDGTLKWTYALDDFVYSSPSVAPDGTIYVGCYDGKLYAINPDGTLKWKYATGDIIDLSSPAIAPDGTVYIGGVDRKLHAVNPDGTLKWAYTAGGDINASPTIGPDGVIYIGVLDKKLYAINPDGAIAPDGTVYVGDYTSKLYAINPDGTLKWSREIIFIASSSPAITGFICLNSGEPDATISKTAAQ